jgi:MFS family permease
MPALVVGRSLQGLGAGAIPAIAYVAIGRSLPDRLRPRMFAILSSAWVVPGLFGPAIAAEVTRQFSWRWVFLGLVPLVLIAGPLALPSLVRLGRSAAGNEPAADPVTGRASNEHRLDDAVRTAAGAGLFLAGLTAPNLVAGAALIALGLVVGVAALRRLLPAGTLAARLGLPATVLSRGLLTFAFFGCDAFVTLAVTSVRHRSPTVASLVVTGGSLTWTAGAWFQARVSDRWEGRRLVRIGLLVIMAGIGGMAIALSSSVPVAVAIASWSMAGFGMGLAYPPLSLMMLREAPPGREGWASASLNLSDVLGTALGVGLGGAAIAASASLGRSLGAGIAVAFAIGAAGALAALAATRRLPIGRLAFAERL